MSDGKRIGYVRVSGVDQNEARQLVGVELDMTYTDKCSGKDVNRPKLQEMLGYVRDGDTVIVHSIDRIARNVDDLRKLVSDLLAKGVTVEFVKESLRFVAGADDSMAKLMLTMMGAFAEFERSLILERQREGIAIAKAEGAYKGRKHALTAAQANAMRQRLAAGEEKAKVAREFGISRPALYRYAAAG